MMTALLEYLDLFPHTNSAAESGPVLCHQGSGLLSTTAIDSIMCAWYSNAA